MNNEKQKKANATFSLVRELSERIFYDFLEIFLRHVYNTYIFVSRIHTGNKRTAEQSCDQKLTRMNKALALNCNAKLNDKVGATAANWKEGIPVRVVRNFKLQKYSKYAPKEGNRYVLCLLSVWFLSICHIAPVHFSKLIKTDIYI